ncbi:olfactory receptor 14C36-like [Ciconia maguari]
MSNSSSISQFLLLAFADMQELQLLHLWLFPGIYLAALLGNGLIITAVACDHHLHTPMYFFHFNLSFLNLGSISTTVPISMANSLWDTRDISYAGCTAQVFLPACIKAAPAAWDSDFPYAMLHTVNTFSLPLCQGNAVDQFFCEIPQILKLSCSRSLLKEFGVLRFTFSTCLPHLTVVSLFASSAMFAYLKPPSISSQSLNVVVAVLYSVVPPTVNALIYSMGTKELKDALRKVI